MSPELPPLIERVQTTLQRHTMTTPGERVLTAVSGGPDSVFLLHALLGLGLPLSVAHFDHQTREGESALDAEFVRNMAHDNDLPFHIESQPVERDAQGSPHSFEAYARKVRYEALFRIARRQGCSVLATGHHADDQAETMLMRLLRGTSPHGLAGIPPVRVEHGIRIVRPLIDCTREELVAYLDENGLDYRLDRSNMDHTCVRNRIRYELIPHLRDNYNPLLSNVLCRLGEVQRMEDAFLDAHARTAMGACVDEDGIIRRRAFSETHPALQRRIILLLAWKQGVDCPFERVEGAREFVVTGGTGQAFDLGGGVLLRNNRETTEFRTVAAPPDETEVRLVVPGEVEAFGRRFRARFLDERPEIALSKYCSPGRQVFDADRLGKDLVLRHRRPGDRFGPYGMEGSKKLKDYFIDVGMPASQRDAQVLLVAGDTIAWVVGLAISGHAAVTSETRRILELEVTDATEP